MYANKVSFQIPITFYMQDIGIYTGPILGTKNGFYGTNTRRLPTSSMPILSTFESARTMAVSLLLSTQTNTPIHKRISTLRV